MFFHCAFQQQREMYQLKETQKRTIKTTYLAYLKLKMVQQTVSLQQGELKQALRKFSEAAQKENFKLTLKIFINFVHYA